MPVDPSILRKHAQPEAPVRQKSDGLRALVVLLAGGAVLLAFFAAAWNAPALAPAFMVTTMIGGAVAMLVVAFIGWQEDGLVGVVYRLRHPFGTTIGGDRRPSWTALACVLLLVLMAAMAGLIAIRHPGFLPAG